MNENFNKREKNMDAVLLYGQKDKAMGGPITKPAEHP
jgi:hypothetical protein